MIPRFPVNHELTHVEIRIFSRLLLGVVALLSACSSFTTTAPLLPTQTSLATVTPTPYPWVDASSVVSGLCFESVYDAADRTFVIHNADELTQLYDLADHSQLCRSPVSRASFDFSGDRILVGLWSRAVGCSAHHDVVDVNRDDSARTYTILLRVVAEGDCGYDLVRPFWIGLSGLTDYDIQLRVECDAASCVH